MVVSAVVSGVSSVAGGIISSSAASSAAKAEQAAAQSQISLEQNEFNQEQQNIQPFLNAGTSALSALSAGFGANGQFTQQFSPGAFQNTPQYAGYQFQQQQGQQGIQAQAAATGRAFSPATAAALSSYNQGLAATDYQSWYNSAYQQWQNSQTQQIQGLEGLVNTGVQSNAQLNQAGQAATQGEVNAYGAIGNAQAANATAQGNAMNNALSGVTNAFTGYNANQYYASLFNTTTPAATTSSATSNALNSSFYDPSQVTPVNTGNLDGTYNPFGSTQIT